MWSTAGVVEEDVLLQQLAEHLHQQHDLEAAALYTRQAEESELRALAIHNMMAQSTRLNAPKLTEELAVPAEAGGQAQPLGPQNDCHAEGQRQVEASAAAEQRRPAPEQCQESGRLERRRPGGSGAAVGRVQRQPHPQRGALVRRAADVHVAA